MPKHRSITVSLVDFGSIIEEFHYGLYSRYWWKITIDKENGTYFPLRVGQKTKTCLNNCDFYITIVIGNKNNVAVPGYLCQSPLVLGWQDEDIIHQLLKDVLFVPILILVDSLKIFVYGIGISSQANWLNAGPGYKSSFMYKFNSNKQAIYVSKIEEDKCILEIYQDNQMKKKFEGETPIAVWEKSEQMKKYNGDQLFGLENSLLQILYPKNHKFGDRELRAWQSMLRDAGSHNVTPWSNKESEYQFWSRSSQPEQDRATLQQLSKIGFLTSAPIYIPNKTKTFWSSFRRALDDNKQNCDGKRRVLSIIADEFSYSELETNLNVSTMIVYNKKLILIVV
ncbi:unnamed protein product [Rhizophagus irregularis]|nr:unnamed protein product [Rhizophagus irregularis]